MILVISSLAWSGWRELLLDLLYTEEWSDEADGDDDDEIKGDEILSFVFSALDCRSDSQCEFMPEEMDILRESCRPHLERLFFMLVNFFLAGTFISLSDFVPSLSV